ncbi:coproporphyrinogen III oxidase [Treponema sp. R8-4-B8]
MKTSASLYIHIPFCDSFCDYCDFYSVTVKNLNEEYIESFITALITDIKFQIEYFNINEIPTVYIGGGTPSVLGTKISPLFEALKEIPFFTHEEFTVEANPESITEEFLSLCRRGGVNRLSLGAQTFHEPSRLSVNRKGNAFFLESQLNLACQYFPGAQSGADLSFDLMTGFPHQDEKIIEEDINRVCAHNPSHISLYSLTLEKNTALEEKIKAQKIILPDSDKTDSLWLYGRDLLKSEGYNHYEVSNFALDGKQCLHNLRYWQMKNWIGAGPSASGTLINEDSAQAKRFTYAHDVDAYIKSPLITSALCENIDKTALLKDVILMGFRLKEGPDRELFKSRFGLTLEESIPETLEKWKEKDKMLFLNSFLNDAFMEIDGTFKTLFQNFLSQRRRGAKFLSDSSSLI